MDLQRLRYFVAVAEELHFSRAASRLYLDQGALSASIRRLERDLGIRLFDRTSRRVELTAAGAALIDGARDVVSRADNLFTTARSFRKDHPRHLRVGLFFGTYAAVGLTEPILATFRRRYPDIHLRVVPLDLVTQHTAITEDRVDVALIRLPHEQSETTITPLFEEPRVVVGSRSASWTDADRLTRHDFEVLQRYHFPTVSAQPTVFEEFYQLADQWDVGELSTIPIGADSADIVGFLHGPASVIVTADSRARTAVPDLPSVPLHGIPGSRCAVVARPYPTAESAAFVDCARSVTDQLIELVPGAKSLINE